MGHTITIRDDGNGEANSYWVAFSGDTRPEKGTVHGATTDDSDGITQTAEGYRVEGEVYGGRDAYRYYGKRLGMAFEHPERIRIKINDQDWQPPSAFGETISWSGGSGGSGGSGSGGSGGSGSGGSGSGGSGSSGGGSNDGSEGNNNSASGGSGGGGSSGDGGSSGGGGGSSGDGGSGDSSGSGGSGGNCDAGSLPASGDGPIERHGIRFKTVLHAVNDLGMDPNGNEPIDEKLSDAAADYTLIVFPDGAFAKHEKTVHTGLQNFGLCGQDATRFVAPEGFNGKFVVIDRGMNTLFENIDVDLRANNATPGLHLAAQDGLDVRHVRYRGQGIHPDSTPRGEGSGNPDVTNALNAHVRAPDGTGRVKHVIAHNAGLMGAYNEGDGRVGIFTGRANEGTLTIEGCNIEGFPNNGLYTSRTNGAVQVEGGLFRNNDISQVRLGSEGSYVQNALLEVDMRDSRSPNPESALNTRGVRFDGPKSKVHGAEARDSTIRIADTPHSDGAVVANQDTGAFGVHNVRIRIDTGGVRGVVGKQPCGIGNRSPPPTPHAATIEQVSVIGRGGAAPAIRLVDRPNSTINELCVSCDGKNRTGVRCTGSSGTTVRNSNVNVSGTPVEGAATENLTTDKDCPGDEGSTTQDEPWELAVEAAAGKTVYVLGGDGAVEKRGSGNGDGGKPVLGTAHGELDGTKHRYRIDGASRVFVAADGPVTLYRDGTEVGVKDLRTGA
ncbi:MULTISPECIES: hypothetical protein [Halococcus]|uniref:Right handed beta helix domain-containing protein n=1 Tax=Halococcus salifodinae DSM 8989 TaxID=1227456 RepID=M0MU76_9EURY|nr:MULTISPECIES: hypothetical protein [Halococcus]EMA49171.1 hypothetical protein C450_17948 [Halococcus salifodinae DSM 8989]